MTRQAEAFSGARERESTSQAMERRRGSRRRTDRHEPNKTAVAGAAALATLDKLNRGVILLDATGSVCFANQAAEAMVARKDGLLVRCGRLQFEAADTNAMFESFLNSESSKAAGGSLVLRVGETRQRDPYRVLVSPLATQSGRSSGHCVFIYEPNGGHRPVPSVVLQMLYGLTTAEARLANALFRGRSLSESADAVGISINTAKSVLKRIFTKCSVSSQSELVLLLSLGPRTL